METGTLTISEYTTNLGILTEILIANGYELKIEAETYKNVYKIQYTKKGDKKG